MTRIHESILNHSSHYNIDRFDQLFLLGKSISFTFAETSMSEGYCEDCRCTLHLEMYWLDECTNGERRASVHGRDANGSAGANIGSGTWRCRDEKKMQRKIKENERRAVRRKKKKRTRGDERIEAGISTDNLPRPNHRALIDSLCATLCYIFVHG